MATLIIINATITSAPITPPIIAPTEEEEEEGEEEEDGEVEVGMGEIRVEDGDVVAVEDEE